MAGKEAYLDKEGLDYLLSKLPQPSNPNLLINPDFKINQRGQEEYSGYKKYTVDRWRIDASNVDVRIFANPDHSITIKPFSDMSESYLLGSYLEPMLSDITVTMSVKVKNVVGNGWGMRCRIVDDGGSFVTQIRGMLPSDGFFFVTGRVPANGHIESFQIFGSNDGTNSEITLEWAKLEIGDKATPFVPPDPATELIKCQRYFQIYKHKSPSNDDARCTIGMAYALASTSAISVFSKMPMRNGVIPTVSFKNVKLIIGGGTEVNVSSISSPELTDNTTCLAFTVENQTPDTRYRVRLWSADAFISLDAEIY